MTNKKALIIEDNREIGEIYRLTIGMIGYDCEQITNGKVALDRLDAEIPDIIILDMNLPEVSGHYLYKKIRASPNYDRVPVIISTANMLVARSLESELHPQDRLLVKPVHPRALTDLIELLEKTVSAEETDPTTPITETPAEEISTGELPINKTNTDEISINKTSTGEIGINKTN